MLDQEFKFNNKYRILSARLRGFDYSQNGAYFITICAKNRESFFGEITEGEMALSEMGKIVADEWQKTAEIRGNVELGESVVMPNHFHGILIINNFDTVSVETHCNASLQQSPYQNKFGPQSQNVSAIIRGFKGATTKQIHIAGFKNFAWQSRFHDHIIRNQKEYDQISTYIINNPNNWNQDENFI